MTNDESILMFTSCTNGCFFIITIFAIEFPIAFERDINAGLVTTIELRLKVTGLWNKKHKE